MPRRPPELPTKLACRLKITTRQTARAYPQRAFAVVTPGGRPEIRLAGRLPRNGLCNVLRLGKAAFERLVQDLFIETSRVVLKLQQVHRVRDHIARMAAAEGMTGPGVVPLDK